MCGFMCRNFKGKLGNHATASSSNETLLIMKVAWRDVTSVTFSLYIDVHTDIKFSAAREMQGAV